MLKVAINRDFHLAQSIFLSHIRWARRSYFTLYLPKVKDVPIYILFSKMINSFRLFSATLQGVRTRDLYENYGLDVDD